MKKTNKRFARKIAAMLAAAMMMTTAAAISASADNEMKSDEFVCTYECPTLYDQIRNWVKQITEQQKKTDTTKPRLKDMKYLELSRYVKDNYNMSWDQMYIVWIDTKQHVLNDDNIDYVIYLIRYGMEREERFGCTPNWTEDMIRFIRDFWYQIPELEFELIHI